MEPSNNHIVCMIWSVNWAGVSHGKVVGGEVSRTGGWRREGVEDKTIILQGLGVLIEIVYRTYCL